jgi:hypothetical protein
VEILRTRTYRIDPTNNDPILGAQAIVSPGIYPLMHDGLSYLWLMTGSLDGNSIRRGDGLFIFGEGDRPIDELRVTFPSPVFGPDEWSDLLESDMCREGHPDQRLRIKTPSSSHMAGGS